MKKLFFFLAIFFLSSFIVPTRSSSGNTTIQSSDDGGVIIHTGAAATYTLGSVATGFVCTVVNHGTGNVTFSGNIRTGNSQNITVLSNYSTIMTPGTVGNSIRLLYDGSIWRSIN